MKEYIPGLGEVEVIELGPLSEFELAEIGEPTNRVIEKQSDFAKLAEVILGRTGAMISGSKSGYRQMYPKNLVVFNANVCTDAGKIWYGDLDITRSDAKLKTLAEQSGQSIHVLYEMDCRFDTEEKPNLNKAVYTIQYSGEEIIRENYARNVEGVIEYGV